MANLPFSNSINELALRYLSLNTADPQNYDQANAILESFFKQHQFKLTRCTVPSHITGTSPRHNLVTKKFTTSTKPTLVIYNHIDVIPATYANAFNPRVKNGKLYARGASDHKGGTIAALSALEELTQSRFNLIVITTTDEETGQLPQLQFLFNKLNLTKNTLLFDTDTYAGGITVARYGRLNLCLKVLGKATHAGTASQGSNAIENSLPLIHTILKYKQLNETKKSSLDPIPTANLKQINNRVNLTQIDTNNAINVIPQHCILGINLRFIPELNDFEETNQFIKLIQDTAQLNHIQFDIIKQDLISGQVSKHTQIDRFTQIHQEIIGSSGQYAVPISNPMIDIAKHLKLPLFGLGLMRHDTNVHADNEFAYIQDMLNLSRTLKLFLQQ